MSNGKMRRKGDLPSKPCAHCGRPFTWRRKWERVWDEVRYCSDACRRLEADGQNAVLTVAMAAKPSPMK